MTLRRFIARRRKPIIGAIAGAVTWIGLKLGLELDPEDASWIAGLVFAVVVERVPNAQ